LIAPKTSEIWAGAQLEQLGALPLRQRNRFPKACFSSVAIPGDLLQIASQPERLGLEPFGVRRLGKLLGFGDVCKSNLRLAGHPIGVWKERENVWHVEDSVDPHPG
jgi:hypothetical protein